jgi:hypothetical protein
MRKWTWRSPSEKACPLYTGEPRTTWFCIYRFGPPPYRVYVHSRPNQTETSLVTSSQGIEQLLSILATRKYYSWETSTRSDKYLQPQVCWWVRVSGSGTTNTHEYLSDLYRGLCIMFQGSAKGFTIDSAIYYWSLLVQLPYNAILMVWMAQICYICSIYHVYTVYVPIPRDNTHEYQ